MTRTRTAKLKSYMKRLRQVCAGKVGHDRVGAIIAARKLGLRRYECYACGKWHLTHQTADDHFRHFPIAASLTRDALR